MADELPFYVFDPTPLHALVVLVVLLAVCACLNSAQLAEMPYDPLDEVEQGVPLSNEESLAKAKESLKQMEEQLQKLGSEAEKQEGNIQRTKGDLGNMDRALLFLVRVRARAKLKRMRQRGVLRVRLDRAIGLKPGDWVGLKVGNVIRESADPFVVIEAGKGQSRKECRSRVIARTLDPVWNEDFEFFGTLGEFVSSGVRLSLDN